MVPRVAGAHAQKADRKHEQEPERALMQIVVEQLLQNHKKVNLNHRVAPIPQLIKNQSTVRMKVVLEAGFPILITMGHQTREI